MMDHQTLLLSPSDFIALLNQTLEYAFPKVIIEGELANFRISKNRWVYFDIKDEFSSVRFFGTVYNLPGPLEDGMLLRVTGAPRFHPQFGFSVGVQAMELSGEGTIKKAFALLEVKLQKEGLFDAGRKRPLPFPPASVGLITSAESAAYADFVKILGVRWGGIQIELADVQVQGEPAAGQVMRAIEYFNTLGEPPEVIVIIRGGGSSDDLQTFNTELVTRAIAASRIPTLVAIGHEIDTSLAELAADLRASTPSNAAELLVPDKTDILLQLNNFRLEAGRLLSETVNKYQKELQKTRTELASLTHQKISRYRERIMQAKLMLELINPLQVLKRGYSVVRKKGLIIRSTKNLSSGEHLDITLADGSIQARIE